MKLEKIFINDELNIELASYIDAWQNKWFRGKDVAKILRYILTQPKPYEKLYQKNTKIKGASGRRGVCNRLF